MLCYNDGVMCVSVCRRASMNPRDWCGAIATRACVVERIRASRRRVVVPFQLRRERPVLLEISPHPDRDRVHRRESSRIGRG